MTLCIAKVGRSIFCLRALLLLALLPGCQPHPVERAVQVPTRTLAEPMSGSRYQSAETQTLQADEFANPGLLWVDQGRTLWQDEPRNGAASCQGCHGKLADMRGVATRYPVYDAQLDRLLNLTQRVERCRQTHQQQRPLPYEAEPLLALTAALTHESRGLAFQPNIEGAARPFFDAGEAYFFQRRGQMNLACHHCHEVNAGRMLRGDLLSQGHGTGYPTYRLQWQELGSLHRRLRFCNQGIRAEPFDYGAAEYVNLELYLAWRAAQLPLEAPAVRR